ncbi:PQ loop repeat protein [Aaosphaeria arxii CBS 175.79]|uniref:PQ loop repeat protein n=1 Tax=Aaosphaeria arxii CBS 175.79 TaxID=1450172 RepID=A0A6A5Y9W9_9PLEO|nr:PQ loop repeat protein [Aaosphaeria arxii CBS 175.79]KAF2021394.1 PQ loop repeat protein [Aaosphaeria arxii CBS 175.79]
MFPPSQGLQLDIDAISQICGSVSIACWIVVFSPQIIENWKRSSAEGLSVVFITIWLLGDFFNIIGAVLQGVLPTMIILAVYYTLADIVLLLQCFWYNGFTLKDKVSTSENGNGNGQSSEPTERSALLSGNTDTNGHATPPRIADADRRHSQGSFRERILSVDGTHLSPVTPLLPDSYDGAETQPQPPPTPQSTLKTIIFNFAIVVLVCASGVLGWYLSAKPPSRHPAPSRPEFNTWGQVSGYVCAVLYLGSRVPQLLLNYRRKSTEGISMLFFLFACIGNLTYVLSIVAYKPVCGGHKGHCAPGEVRSIYGRYIAVNFSWLLGSFGTLLLDAAVFIQYFMYRKDDDESDEEDAQI